MSFTVNNLYSQNHALKINYYEDFIIPYLFSISQNQLIITIFNSDNINQREMGGIIPYSEYNLNGQLEYLNKPIYTGNQLLQFSPLSDFRLKFRPRANGNYFISVDELLS